MSIPDSSVLIPGLAAWHENHELCAAVLRPVDVLVAHTMIETFSVLTRLPGHQRLEAVLVARLLTQFTRRRAPLTLGGAAVAALPGRCADAGVGGGATYDALIGLTAAHHDEVLLTRDVRAIRIYESLGVPYEIVR